MRKAILLLLACGVVSADTNPRRRSLDPLGCRIVATFGENNGRVYSASFSADGRLLATAGDDTNIRIWSVATKKVVKTIEVPRGRVFQALFSPDGKYIVSGNINDRAVCVYDASSGNQIQRFTNVIGYLQTAAVSPDSKRVAVAQYDRSCRVYDIETGNTSVTLTGHTSYVYAVGYSKDGKKIATSGLDRTIRVWDASNGAELLNLTGHTQYVYSLAFSPNGRMIVTAGLDGVLKVWDAGAGTEKSSIQTNAGNLYSVTFSANSRWIATAGRTGKVHIYEAATGKLVREIDAHRGPVWSVQFSADGRWMVTSGDDGKVHLWGSAAPIDTTPKKDSKKTGKPAFLGITGDADADGEGVEISSVVSGSSAETAGLQSGDVITSVGGKSVTNFEELRDVISGLVEGEEVEVKYKRSGTESKVKVKLGARPDDK